MQISEKCAYYKDNQKISYAQKFYYYLNFYGFMKFLKKFHKYP